MFIGNQRFQFLYDKVEIREGFAASVMFVKKDACSKK